MAADNAKTIWLMIRASIVPFVVQAALLGACYLCNRAGEPDFPGKQLFGVAVLIGGAVVAWGYLFRLPYDTAPRATFWAFYFFVVPPAMLFCGLVGGLAISGDGP
jgi:hypothetical protein